MSPFPTMRNNPYENEWQKDYMEVASSADFFNSIRNSVDASFVD
jgi:hypothetical protein